MQRRWALWAIAALLLSGAWCLHRVQKPAPQSSHTPPAGILIPQIGHDGGIRAFALAPDAQTVATLGETVKFWDSDTGALRRTLTLGAKVWQPRNLRFSPQGSTLAFLDDTPQGTTLHLLHTDSGRARTLKTGGGYCRDFAFAGETQLCLDTYNSLRTYDLRSGLLKKQTRLASAYPWGAVADGIALSGVGSNWKLLNLPTGRTHTLKRALSLQAAAFSADGHTLVTGQNRFPPASSHHLRSTTQGKIRFSLLKRDEGTPQMKRTLRPIPQPPAAPDGTLALWDTRHNRLRRVITAFPAQVGAFRNLALSSDGRWVAAYGSESFQNSYRAVLKQWDSQSGKLKGTWPLQADGFLATTMAIGDDGTITLAGLKIDESGIAGTPQVWNTRTRSWHGIEAGTLTDNWQRLEWSPNGALLAGGSTIGMAPRGFWGNLSGYYYSSYSLSGAMPTFLFSSGTEFEAQTIRLWDLQKGTMRRSFWGPIVSPRSSSGQGATALQQGGLASMLGVCAFSSDSRLIATDEGGAIALRDASSGALVRTLAPFPANWPLVGDWSQLRWSPNGQTLLAITASSLTPANSTGQPSVPATLTLWNTQSGKLKALLGTAQKIQASFSANGHAIVAVMDGKPRGWEASTGTPLHVIALPALPRGAKELCPPLLTQQGKLLRAIQRKETAFLETREILNGKLTRYEFPSPFNKPSLAPRQLFVAPDSSSVGVLQANGALALWNLREWKLLGHVPIPSGGDVIAAPAPGGRLIAVAAPEGAIKVFDPASPAPLTLQVFPARQPRRGGHDWAIFSERFLAASPQARRQLKRSISGSMLPIEP
jgi:WD40 repeat protein